MGGMIRHVFRLFVCGCFRHLQAAPFAHLLEFVAIHCGGLFPSHLLAALRFDQSLRRRQSCSTTNGAIGCQRLRSNDLVKRVQDQGKLDEAEPLFRQALENAKMSWAPRTLSTLNNLAALLKDQSKLEVAEPLFRQALEESQNILGPDHTDTLISANNLAVSLEAQGKLQEAKPLFRHVLERKHQILGSDHPSTLTSMFGLAYLLYKKRDTANAKILLLDCLEKSRRVLGQDHPHTIRF